MTNEEQDATIKALLYERAGYERRMLPERVKLVDEQLAKLGYEAQPKVERASKRPAQQRANKR